MRTSVSKSQNQVRGAASVVIGRRDSSEALSIVSKIAIGALALFVFSIPTENGVSLPGGSSLSRLIGVIAMALGVVSLVDRGRVRFRTPSLFLLLATAFVAWSAVTYFWSLAPAVTISRTFQFAQLLLLAWLVHQLARTDRDRDLLTQAFVLGCLLMITVALAVYVTGVRGGYRDVAFSANEFAAVAALGIPMAWGLMLRRAFPRFQILNTVYPLFALTAIVLAASRGGLLTALVALVIVPIALPHMGVVRRVLLVGSVAAIAVLTFTWFPQAVPDLERNLDRLGRIEEDLVGGTMTGRTGIWAAGAEVFLGSPVHGTGSGTYSRAVQPILGRALGAHNAFLSVAVTTGLVGLSLFGAMLAVVFLGLTAAPRRADYAILFVALVVSIMPLNVENNKFVWFILALIASARPVMLRVASSVDRQRRQPVRQHSRPSARVPLP